MKNIISLLKIKIIVLIFPIILIGCANARTGIKWGAVYKDAQTNNIYEINGEFYIEKRDGSLEKDEKAKPDDKYKHDIKIEKDEKGETFTIDGKKYKKEGNTLKPLN